MALPKSKTEAQRVILETTRRAATQARRWGFDESIAAELLAVLQKYEAQWRIRTSPSFEELEGAR